MMNEVNQFVLAGNYAEYFNWCIENKYTPREYRYLGSIKQLYGSWPMKVTAIGTWEGRKDILPILIEIGRLKKVGE